MNSTSSLSTPTKSRDPNATHALPPVEKNTRVEAYPKPGIASAPPVKPSTSTSGYTVWSPAQLFTYQPDPSSSLLGDRFVERGEWTSFIGIGGLGKTRLLLWLCISQITGRDWCGIKTAGKPQKCLILSTESGLRRWKSDLEKIYATLTPTERELVSANLRLLALTPDEEGDMNLGDEENCLKLAATLRAENPGIIGFDPFSDMVIGDENSTADLILTLRTLRAIQRVNAPNAAGIILHHARTGAANVAQAGDNYASGNFGRGSKALYSRVRCEMQLAPGDRDNSNLLVLACGKANDAEKFKPRGVIFDPETFSYSVDPTFDLEAWRSDVAGKRGNKSVSIADVVGVVQELVRCAGDEVKAGVICDAVKESTGACVRTVKMRISEAVKDGYLRKGAKIGAYALGSKPLKK